MTIKMKERSVLTPPFKNLWFKFHLSFILWSLCEWKECSRFLIFAVSKYCAHCLYMIQSKLILMYACYSCNTLTL